MAQPTVSDTRSLGSDPGTRKVCRSTLQLADRQLSPTNAELWGCPQSAMSNWYSSNLSRTKKKGTGKAMASVPDSTGPQLMTPKYLRELLPVDSFS